MVLLTPLTAATYNTVSSCLSLFEDIVEPAVLDAMPGRRIIGAIHRLANSAVHEGRLRFLAHLYYPLSGLVVKELSLS